MKRWRGRNRNSARGCADRGLNKAASKSWNYSRKGRSMGREAKSLLDGSSFFSTSRMHELPGDETGEDTIRDTSATVTVNYLLINILHDTYVVFIHSYHSTLLLLLFIKYSSVCTSMAEVYIYFVNYCSKLLALRNVERNNDWILLTSGSFSEGNKWKKRLIRIRFEPIFTIGCERNPWNWWRGKKKERCIGTVRIPWKIWRDTLKSKLKCNFCGWHRR